MCLFLNQAVSNQNLLNAALGTYRTLRCPSWIAQSAVSVPLFVLFGWLALRFVRFIFCKHRVSIYAVILGMILPIMTTWFCSLYDNLTLFLIMTTWFCSYIDNLILFLLWQPDFVPIMTNWFCSMSGSLCTAVCFEQNVKILWYYELIKVCYSKTFLLLVS